MRRVLDTTVVLALLAAAACGSGAAAPTAPAAPAAGEAYLRELVGIMQANSMNRQTIDWPSFQAQVLARAPAAKTIPDTFPAIELALRQLNDHHSFYQLANSPAVIRNPTAPVGCNIGPVADPAVPPDIGYVRIGSFSGAGSVGDDFATAIQATIRARDGSGVIGWIVDLRGNGGGNMWPMLAGVGPILGSGIAGYFVPPAGAPTPFSYRDGTSFEGNNAAASVAAPYELRQPNPRVAVLTNQAVASSGEAIAVAFRGRPGTRTFGADTCGLPTANESYTLSDGATLFLTVAREADRTMTLYDSPLPPDERIDDPALTVQRAIAWLRGGS